MNVRTAMRATLTVRIAAAIVATSAPVAVARGEIVVSANDGKQVRPGEAATRTADTLAIFDLRGGRLSPLGAVTLPASMIGPPESIALTRDRRLALVTASQRLDGSALVADDTLSVVDLTDRRHPRVVQTLRAGAGASGVALNARGTLALVANAAADSVSVFTIARGRLEPAGTVALDPGSKPVSVKFTPDGRSALVVAQTAGMVVPLAIDGAVVRRDGAAIVVGGSPYMIAMAQSGAFAFVTNLRGPAGSPPGSPGTIVTIAVATRAVAGAVVAGVTPEHVVLSPSGRYLQATLINGSNAMPDARGYRDHGLIRVFGVAGGTLTPIAEARTCRWGQGAAWSADERRVMLQCADARRIEVYRFDGRSLIADPAGAITLEARPGTLVGARD